MAKRNSTENRKYNEISIIDFIRRARNNGKNEYTCEKCDYKAPKKSDMTTHKELEHEDKTLACEQCDYKTYQMGDLIEHNKTIHKQNSFACAYCDYKATMESNLNQHTKTNHKGDSFSCDQCDYKATLKSNLEQHTQMVHKKYHNEEINEINEDSSISTQEMIKAARNRRSMKNTMRIEQKSKTYVSKRIKCEKCEMKFNKNETYAKHMIKLHGEYSQNYVIEERPSQSVNTRGRENKRKISAQVPNN